MSVRTDKGGVVLYCTGCTVSMPSSSVKKWQQSRRFGNAIQGCI